MKKTVVSLVTMAALGAGLSTSLGAGVLARQGQGQGQGQGMPGGAAMPSPQLPKSTAAEVNGYYNTIAGYISKSLPLVPDDKLSWSPTPAVRSFARQIGR